MRLALNSIPKVLLTISIACPLLLGACGGTEESDTRCQEILTKLSSCQTDTLQDNVTCGGGVVESYDQIMAMDCDQLEAAGKADGWGWNMPFTGCGGQTTPLGKSCMATTYWSFGCTSNPDLTDQERQWCCQNDNEFSSTSMFCGNQGTNWNWAGCDRFTVGGKPCRVGAGWTPGNQSSHCQPNPQLSAWEQQQCCQIDGNYRTTSPACYSGYNSGYNSGNSNYDDWLNTFDNSGLGSGSGGYSGYNSGYNSGYSGAPGYSPGTGSDPDCEFNAMVCKQFPGTMCTLTEIGPPPSYSKWPQTGWRCRNLDGGSSHSPGSPYNSYNSYSSGKPGVGDICIAGAGRAYTCVDVTSSYAPGGGSNPCQGAQPGDPRIVVNKCMAGDNTVRCCLLLPRQGFGMADDIGQEIASGEGTVGGCSVSAGPGAGAPSLTLVLLLLGLVVRTRRS
jgi:MYXO-CTERM domain-containing protein